MPTPSQPEYWLRGPVKGVSAFLQPVAHALLQARDEIAQIIDNIPDDKLWMKPNDNASAGFHLRHMTGVLDRLFTYAKGKQLSDEQLKYLVLEGTGDETTTAKELFEQFNRQVD
ncbi:MAG TPA: DinB family protein, partial [Chitinophagaceae bacterium]|nr:DinB family protein [Chitinophagaceae bacterium]